VLEPTLKRIGEWGAIATSTATASVSHRPGDGCRVLHARIGHNELAQYSERRGLLKNLDRLARKFETARTLVPQARVEMVAGASRHHRLWHDTLGDRGVARSAAQRDRLETSYLRLRAYRSRRTFEFIDTCDRSTSSSRTATPDAVAAAMECTPAQIAQLRAILHYAAADRRRTVTTD
jgi:hypothetical protein